MALVGPPPLIDQSPLGAIVGDLREERAASVPFPPGDTNFSLRRTRRFAEEVAPSVRARFSEWEDRWWPRDAAAATPELAPAR